MTYSNVFPAASIPSPNADFFIIPIVVVLGANTLLFAYCQSPLNKLKRDNSWIDTMWGMIFVISNATVLIMRAVNGNSVVDGKPYCEQDCGITTRMWLISIPVFIWGLRLAIYIFIRKGGEDYRYKQMREDWEAQGTCVYYTKAYFYIFFGQGVLHFINNSAILYVNIFSKNDDGPIFATDIIGVCIWVIGFLIEVFADKQLAAHLKWLSQLPKPWPPNSKFIKVGLWRYSRHPNYFGEAVMWWGLWLIACGIDYGWITFFAPLFITFCLRFVSGVPFPEKKYKDNKEWQEYCAETNVFCLWFAKVNAVNVDEGYKEIIV